MKSSHIDHLVVTAPSLEVGMNYVEAALGARPQPGGEHVALLAAHQRRELLTVASFEAAGCYTLTSSTRQAWTGSEIPFSSRSPKSASSKALPIKCRVEAATMI